MRKAVIVLLMAAVVCTVAFALTACNATPDGIADRFEDLAADGKFEVKRGTAGESAVYDFGRQVTVNTLVLKEVRDAVTSFRLYADDSEEPFYGNDYIGGYRYCSFDEITLSKLRIEVLSCEKLWQMKSVEAYNISGTDPEDDFRIMGYVTVESAVAMGEEHNANLDAATHLNLIGNIYFTSVSDIVFDDITLKSGEKMDGEEAFALAVEKMREANPDGKLIVTFLGNKDLTGDGLEIEDRHNEAMGEHKDKLIAGIVAVDGENQLVPQIEAAGNRCGVDFLRHGVGLLEHVVGKYVIHAVFVQDARDRGFHCAVLAQICFDDALRQEFFVAIVGNGHGNAVAGLGVAQIVPVDRDLGVFLGCGLDEIRLTTLHQRARNLTIRALQHTDDLGFAPPAAVFALAQLDQHAVAMPRAACCAGRDEQVVRLGRAIGHVGRDKGKRPLGGQISAGRAAIVRGHSKAVFLVFHHLPVRQQTVERVLQLVFGRVRQGAAYLVDTHGLHKQRQQPAFQLGMGHRSALLPANSIPLLRAD